MKSAILVTLLPKIIELIKYEYIWIEEEAMDGMIADGCSEREIAKRYIEFKLGL